MLEARRTPEKNPKTAQSELTQNPPVFLGAVHFCVRDCWTELGSRQLTTRKPPFWLAKPVDSSGEGCKNMAYATIIAAKFS